MVHVPFNKDYCGGIFKNIKIRVVSGWYPNPLNTGLMLIGLERIKQTGGQRNTWERGQISGFIKQRLASIKGRLPSKVVFR